MTDVTLQNTSIFGATGHCADGWGPVISKKRMRHAKKNTIEIIGLAKHTLS